MSTLPAQRNKSSSANFLTSQLFSLCVCVCNRSLNIQLLQKNFPSTRIILSPLSLLPLSTTSQYPPSTVHHCHRGFRVDHCAWLHRGQLCFEFRFYGNLPRSSQITSFQVLSPIVFSWEIFRYFKYDFAALVCSWHPPLLCSNEIQLQSTWRFVFTLEIKRCFVHFTPGHFSRSKITNFYDHFAAPIFF